MKTFDDCEKYEGKKIQYIQYSSVTGNILAEVEGVVVGCDYDIGISIVSNDDDKIHLCCLIGPSAPNRENYRPCTDEEYNEIFSKYIDCIEEGVLTHTPPIFDFGQMNSTQIAKACPFGQ